MNNLVFNLIDKELYKLEQNIARYERYHPQRTKTITKWKCMKEYYEDCKKIMTGSMDSDALNFDIMGCCEE